MRKFKKAIVFAVTIALLVTVFCPVFNASAGQTNLKNRVVGYLPSYRSAEFASIDYSAVSHVILSFLTYNNGTMTCPFTASQFQQLRAYCDAEDVKLMIGLGGWGGFNYSNSPVDTAAEREQLVEELMYYVDTYDLDGIDIDVEITNSDFWTPFPQFAELLNNELDADGKLLTMAVSPWITNGNVSASTYNYFDFINLMTYDYSKTDVAPMSQVYSQINTYSGYGLSNDRMTIGVPFYGYGSGGTAYTYGEIIRMSTGASQLDNYNGISYNGMPTIIAKAEYSLDYGGIMIWELGQDSFDQYSLLGAIKSVYEQSASSVAAPTNLTASDITYTSINLSWTASPDAVSYNIYNGNELIGTTTNTHYTVTGLSEGTSYTFKVTAVANNEESNAARVSAETSYDASAIPEWDSTAVYTQGDQVVRNGSIYQAKYWTQGNDPDTSTEWGPWAYVGEASTTAVGVTGITLYKNGTAITSGASETVADTASAMSFTASVSPSNATEQGFTLTVSNSTVAAVNGNTATVTPANATADTSVVITATSTDGGYTASYTVNIDYTEQVDPGEPDQPDDPEPETVDAFVFKVGSLNAYWATYDYAFTTGVACQFVDSVTYVPFRDIANAAGAKSIDFDASAGTVTIVNGYDMTFVLTMNSTACTVTFNGSTQSSALNSAPQFIDGVCCLPIRDVSNITFASVNFVESDGEGYVLVSANALSDAETKQVIATYNDKF